jgi:radical SAM protein (TIGR01212 family)
MVGLSIGTRPDCIDRSVLELLSSYKDDFLVWVEYGLQSAHDKTLEKINRGHSVSCFEDAVRKTSKYGLNICSHVILGLPGETRNEMLQTARFLSKLPIQGVKIHLMYVIKGTPLEQMYKNGKLACLEREEFTELVVDFLELLPPNMVIQRITGDPPVKSELVAPMWALDKSDNIKHIRDTLVRRDTWQGRLFKKYTAGN